jgi:hypothetical protein
LLLACIVVFFEKLRYGLEFDRLTVNEPRIEVLQHIAEQEVSGGDARRGTLVA